MAGTRKHVKRNKRLYHSVGKSKTSPGWMLTMAAASTRSACHFACDLLWRMVVCGNVHPKVSMIQPHRPVRSFTTHGFIYQYNLHLVLSNIGMEGGTIRHNSACLFWAHVQHRGYWASLTRQIQAKFVVSGPATAVSLCFLMFFFPILSGT